ncbi:hypothetical protein F3Y22_tig00112528pilonHSYRG00036 [Hibiscus syriacus]|uniref:Pentatricopeptide repeat-containing protein n=1 Tax=Hibiscus syriacus TaxID=106335 RepID=A0A6A2XF48_HIBSY|nr:hypothetical protein F3Y22_tig00112528pilonHSYRG00036 [Hibiscus syriacus]
MPCSSDLYRPFQTTVIFFFNTLRRNLVVTRAESETQSNSLVEYTQKHGVGTASRVDQLLFSRPQNLIQNSLVEEARWDFDQVSCRDLALWNVMVSYDASDSLTRETFEVFDLMKKEGVKGDDVHVVSALVDKYVKNGNFYDARNAFDGMTARNVVSWNTLIVGYAQHGDVKKIQSIILALTICLDELALLMRLEFSTSQPVACTPDTLGGFVGQCSIHCNMILVKYACKGRSVRKMMTDHCDYNIPGCSRVEVAADVMCSPQMIISPEALDIETMSPGPTKQGYNAPTARDMFFSSVDDCALSLFSYCFQLRVCTLQMNLHAQLTPSQEFR